nr:AmmeMemoRadiSam system protein A [Actinomycetales bacterium]
MKLSTESHSPSSTSHATLGRRRGCDHHPTPRCRGNVLSQGPCGARAHGSGVACGGAGIRLGPGHGLHRSPRRLRVLRPGGRQRVREPRPRRARPARGPAWSHPPRPRPRARAARRHAPRHPARRCPGRPRRCGTRRHPAPGGHPARRPPPRALARGPPPVPAGSDPHGAPGPARRRGGGARRRRRCVGRPRNWRDRRGGQFRPLPPPHPRGGPTDRRRHPRRDPGPPRGPARGCLRGTARERPAHVGAAARTRGRGAGLVQFGRYGRHEGPGGRLRLRRIPGGSVTAHSDRLPGYARAVITAALAGGPDPEPESAWREPGATFVTLTSGGRLRGCIGSLAAHRPLVEDLAHNARAAALSDPRFPALQPEELAVVRVEVSVLTSPEPLAAATREEAEALLRPGVDGVVLEAGARRATFLPQVWEHLPEPSRFLDHLLRKAGLPAHWWGPELTLSRYAVSTYREEP